MVHVPEKISAFGCYKKGWTCPDVNVKPFVSVAKEVSWRWPDFLWKYLILSPQTRLEMFPALLKYTRRCHPLFGSKTTREEHVASTSWQWKSSMSNLVHANNSFQSVHLQRVIVLLVGGFIIIILVHCSNRNKHVRTQQRSSNESRTKQVGVR